MLSILATLQYTCKSTIKYGGFKVEVGGECPSKAACSKISSKDLKKEIKDNTGIEFDFDGKLAQCLAVPASLKSACDALCKSECNEGEGSYKATSILGGLSGEVDYDYYCPKGKQKYGGLSAGAIAGIVIACVVVVGVIVFCICYFLVCKKSCSSKKSSSPVHHMKA